MAKPIRTKNVKQLVVLNASPHEVYELLMDSRKHSAFTGDTARISRKVGGKFTVFGDWIDGKNIKLTKDKEIVQSWREATWPKGHYSTVKFTFKREPGGTKLVFTQTGIPDNRYKDIREGWREYYWTKMKEAIASS